MGLTFFWVSPFCFSSEVADYTVLEEKPERFHAVEGVVGIVGVEKREIVGSLPVLTIVVIAASFGKPDLELGHEVRNYIMKLPAKLTVLLESRSKHAVKLRQVGIKTVQFLICSVAYQKWLLTAFVSCNILLCLYRTYHDCQ